MENHIFAVVWICLGMASYEDLRDRRVREGWIWCIAGAGISRLWLGEGKETWDVLLGGCAAFLLFALILLWFPGAFGGGDVKLYAAAGLSLGPAGAGVGLAVAILTAGVALLLSPSFREQKEIPFVPFLSVGIFMGFCFGEQIQNWYLS